MMRRALHAVFVLAGVPLWFFAVGAFALIMQLARAAHRVWPEADCGNCWSFTMPRWHDGGGYLAVRWARGRVRFLGMRIPHAIWVPALDAGTPVEQTLPLRRSSSRLMPQVVYFRYRVSTHEHQDAAH